MMSYVPVSYQDIGIQRSGVFLNEKMLIRQLLTLKIDRLDII